MIRKLLLLPVKLIVALIVLLCMTLTALVKLVSNLSAYLMGPMILFLLGCGLYTATKRLWMQSVLLMGMETICVAVLFGATLLETRLEELIARLIAFLHL